MIEWGLSYRSNMIYFFGIIQSISGRVMCGFRKRDVFSECALIGL